jgi:bifunctional non-homologous end joining protein LigD
MENKYQPQLFGDPIDDAEADRLIASPYYGMEQKADGRRVIIHKHGTKIFGNSRPSLSHPDGLPVTLAKGMVKVLESLSSDFIVDGEIVKGTLVVWDILWQDGQDLRQEGYKARGVILRTLIPTNRHPLYVMQTAWEPAFKRTVYDFLRKRGAEGVCFKNKDAKYEAGRPTGRTMWFRKKWTTTATVRCVRQDPTKSAVFVALKDTGEVCSVTTYPNRPKPKPGDLLEVRYLYADPKSKALIQPVLQRIRTDVSDADSSNNLQYKGGLSG